MEPQQNGGDRSYELFREMLRHPSAQPVIAQIREFVVRFPEGLPGDDAARRVHRFLASTQEWMLSQCVVFAAVADEEGRTKAAEALEKFLISRLHSKLFCVSPSDTDEDTQLQRRTAGLQWVDFRHLGVPSVDPALFSLAIGSLQQIDNYKAPKDKLICVINASHVINDVLKLTRAEGSRPYSADDFLPLLIYSVIQANPPRLHSNVEFVATFRHPSRLVGEDAYFLTALQSAAAFVREAGPTMFDGVSPESFNALCDAALEAWDRQEAATSTAAAVATAVVDSELVPGMAVGCNGRSGGPMKPKAMTVAEKARQLSPAAREQLIAQLAVLPLSFESVQSSQQLRLRDLDILLEEYGMMARVLRTIDDEDPQSRQAHRCV